MIKTAVIGASGYIGSHLWRSYRSQFPDCIGTTFSAEHPALRKFDIRQPDITTLRLVETGHEQVLIASAKPNVSYCENNKKRAYDVNVTGTLELVRQIGRMGLQVMFLSSDYVFDGKRGKYNDDAETNPTTEYGRHKVIVENELPSLVDHYLILRLSKVYGLKKGDGTLLDEMASTLAARREIVAAHDQRFCPTYIEDLVTTIQTIQTRGLSGIINVCAPEIWSRYELAVAVAKEMKVSQSLIKSVSLYDIPLMLGRPLDTSMKCSRIRSALNTAFAPVSEHIKHIAVNWKNNLEFKEKGLFNRSRFKSDTR